MFVLCSRRTTDGEVGILDNRLDVDQEEGGGGGELIAYYSLKYYKHSAVFLPDDYSGVTDFYKQSNNNHVINKLLNDIFPPALPEGSSAENSV